MEHALASEADQMRAVLGWHRKASASTPSHSFAPTNIASQGNGELSVADTTRAGVLEIPVTLGKVVNFIGGCAAAWVGKAGFPQACHPAESA